MVYILVLPAATPLPAQEDEESEWDSTVADDDEASLHHGKRNSSILATPRQDSIKEEEEEVKPSMISRSSLASCSVISLGRRGQFDFNDELWSGCQIVP